MEKAKVYFSDFRTKAFGDGLPEKLRKLMRRRGASAKSTWTASSWAIKMHFGRAGQHQLS